MYGTRLFDGELGDTYPERRKDGTIHEVNYARKQEYLARVMDVFDNEPKKVREIYKETNAITPAMGVEVRKICKEWGY